MILGEISECILSIKNVMENILLEDENRFVLLSSEFYSLIKRRYLDR